MAGYDSSKLRLSAQGIEGSYPGAKLWVYTTAADALATINGAGYFANGVDFGMAVGDLVDVIATTGPKYIRLQVASVSGHAATTAAPTAIS